MRTLMTAAIALGVVSIASPAAAFGLGEAAEAEAARHNARAGGPTNYRDAELLARYGCFDKHDSEFCWNLYRKQRAQARGKRRND